ncbi:MAG: glycerate kinase [Actinomycetota bacterium]
MRIVVGATAVRDLTAGDLTGAVVAGWHAAAPDDLEAFALSDGVTGLAESLSAATGPGSGATVVETAHLLTGSTTAPVARAMLDAVDSGADRVVLGMGRSLVHDGGAGFAAVVRERFGTLAAARAALAGVDVVVVGNDRLPLLGLHGAGARLVDDLGPAEAQRRDREVAAFAAAVGAEFPADLLPGRASRLATAAYSGLGGGSAFLALALGARATSGVEHTVVASGMAAAVSHADLCLVVVDEMDAIALEDSAAAAVAPAALDAGCPVVVLTGEDHTSRHQRAALGIVASYSMGGTLDPEALAVRVPRVARTWTR